MARVKCSISKKDELNDSTTYLLSSKAMRTHLDKSIAEAHAGKVKSININNLWK